MPKQSSHKVSLAPTIRARAKLVLGSLCAATFILFALAVYNGVVSGDIDRVFFQPFRQFAADFNEKLIEEPSESKVNTTRPVKPLFPTTEPTQVPIQKTYQAPVANCTRYNIREGEFASNKCYTDSDYDDLIYYLNRYNTAVFNYNSAIATMRITCSGSDFFKDSCERDQKRKTDSENDMNNYKGIIQAIISRGK